MTDPKRDMLRHTLATLAYRGGKAVQGAPPRVASWHAGPGARTPEAILAHIGDLLDWSLGACEGLHEWRTAAPMPWEEEVEHFFAGLAKPNARLAADLPLRCPPEQLFQGPIADALTHVGQLALLRRLADAPIRGENYFTAEIVAGRVGPEQSGACIEFD